LILGLQMYGCFAKIQKYFEKIIKKYETST
jgi:hypothetical protein